MGHSVQPWSEMPACMPLLASLILNKTKNMLRFQLLLGWHADIVHWGECFAASMPLAVTGLVNGMVPEQEWGGGRFFHL